MQLERLKGATFKTPQKLITLDEFLGVVQHLAHNIQRLKASDNNMDLIQQLNQSTEDVEELNIYRSLFKELRINRKEAARLLGIHVSSLKHRIDQGDLKEYYDDSYGPYIFLKDIFSTRGKHERHKG